MLKNVNVVVAPDEAGRRLDRVALERCASSTRALVIDAIERGQLWLNGRPAGKGVKVRAGDRVTISELAESVDVRVYPQPELPLSVIYEDEVLIALDKPAGQPVHPLDFRETGTLLNALVGRLPELQAVGDDALLPAVLHRIDADTSGLVLAAKNARSYEDLRAQFRAQSVRKIYLATVRGEVKRAGRLEALLIHQSPTKDHRMVVLGDRLPPKGQKPMRAVTEYEPMESRQGRTLLRVTIFTGVTHQIRCQLAHAGFPIEGDRIYGSKGDRACRLELHAAEITFIHPVTRREQNIRSDTGCGFGLKW